MASQYDALLDAPTASPYDALLTNPYDSLLEESKKIQYSAPELDQAREQQAIERQAATGTSAAQGLEQTRAGVGQTIDHVRDFINDAAPGFLDQLTSPAITGTHYAPDQNDPPLTATAKAASNFVSGVAEGVSSPAMVASMVAGGVVPALAKPITAAFLADTAVHFPAAVDHVREVYSNPKSTAQERAEADLNLAGMTAITYALQSHLASPRAAAEAATRGSVAPRPGVPAADTLPQQPKGGEPPNSQDISQENIIGSPQIAGTETAARYAGPAAEAAGAEPAAGAIPPQPPADLAPAGDASYAAQQGGSPIPEGAQSPPGEAAASQSSLTPQGPLTYQPFEGLPAPPAAVDTPVSQPPPAEAGLGAGAATTPNGATDIISPAVETPPPRLRSYRPDGGFAEDPLVQFIIGDQGGILSKSAARQKWGAEKYAINSSLWNDAPAFPDPRHNKIYNTKSGQPPDAIAQAAADAGLLPPGSDATTLWRELQKRAESAHRTAKAERAQAASIATQEKQTRAFTAAAAKPSPGDKPISAFELSLGDTVKVGTETLKVRAIDPETYAVELEDGSKFGIQHVEDGTVFFGEHEAAKVSIDTKRPASLNAASLDPEWVRNHRDEWIAMYAKEIPYEDGKRIVEKDGKFAIEVKQGRKWIQPYAASADIRDLLLRGGMPETLQRADQARSDIVYRADLTSALPAVNTEAHRSGGLPSRAQADRAGVSPAEQTPPREFGGDITAPEVPTLRPGENQGDLLQGADAPFNLAGEKGIDYAARAAEADRAAAAAHDAAVWQEQNQVPFGFGPGAAAQGENLRAGSQISQLTATVSSALRTARPAPVTGRLTRAIEAIGGKFVSALEGFTSAANTVRAATLALKNAYLRPPLEGDFRTALKDWQGADQRISFEARRFVQDIRAQIRDPLVREAITNYIQADGDLNLLAQRAEASNVKYRPGYEAAMHLTDDQKTLAANVRQYFDGMLADGQNAGLLEHGIENYINQIWKRPNKITRELQASVQTGKLQTSFSFARKRIFDSFFAGEQAGYVPASKDVSALVAAYDMAFNRSLAARGFVKSLREARARDGEPVVKFSGMTQPIPGGEAPPEAYLIRSRAMPKDAETADGRPYQIVDHPALRDWKFVIKNDEAFNKLAKAASNIIEEEEHIELVHQGNPDVHYQADMLVHPDHVGELRNVLGTSAFRTGKPGAVVGPILKAGAILKQTKLSLSAFHLDGLFHRVNPANLERIDFDNPKQWALVRGGLQVADYRAMELFSEGLRGGGLVSKVPGLGRVQHAFNEWLFKDYIPRLKMTMALHAYERNVGRYGNAISPDQIAELTARQGNAAFGELNYKLLGRNQTLQDFLRLTLLAPDFLEARSKFVGQALKPYGAEQRQALLLGAAAMYVTARAMNQWLDHDPHWGKPFSVFYNGREYKLRTVMGDMQELAMDPRRFFYNRFSPFLKQGVTIGTGRDYRGVKLTNFEQVKDALSWMVPIPLGGTETATPVQRALGSAGVANKPAPTAVQDAFELARDYRDKLAKTDPKIAAEVVRARQETYAESDYKKLMQYLRDQDNERSVVEIQRLMKETGKTPADMVKYFANLPVKPFTGSQTVESRMLHEMNPIDRRRYEMARAERMQSTRRFFPLLQAALQRK
jgi:hypothetical protein